MIESKPQDYYGGLGWFFLSDINDENERSY